MVVTTTVGFGLTTCPEKDMLHVKRSSFTQARDDMCEVLKFLCLTSLFYIIYHRNDRKKRPNSGSPSLGNVPGTGTICNHVVTLLLHTRPGPTPISRIPLPKMLLLHNYLLSRGKVKIK